MIPTPPDDLTRASGIPRESGDDPFGLSLGVVAGHVFPARAGMIPRGTGLHGGTARIPRESGDDP